MNYCNQCGSPMRDQDKFCNKCGGRPVAAPQYQPVQYQQPYGQPQYDPVPQKPYKPPFWAIGLFILLGFIMVELVQTIVGAVMVATGFFATSTLTSTLLSVFYSVIFVLVTCVGFAIYNSACKRNHHPEKKLSIFWVAVPWLLQEILDFIFGFLWTLLFPIVVYNSAIDERLIGLVTLGWGVVSTIVIALLTWLVSCLILKAVVGGRK